MTETNDESRQGAAEGTTPTPAPAPAPTPAPTATKSAGRGLRVALGISVALNLLVAGLVAGAVLRDGGPRDRMVRDLDFGPFTEALSPEDRAALRQDFMGQMPDLRAVRREMRGDLEALLAVLRVEPFDRAAAAAVLERHGERVRSRTELGQTLLLDRFAAMSPEARDAFADRLERRLRRGPDGRD